MDEANRRILVVDDEPALLKMLGAYLGRLGYDVVTASTTEKAWLALKSSPFDFAVAVLDATMAGLSLEELAMKMLGENPALCILAASGYPVDISALEAAAPGRVAFLHKPFTPERLAAALRRLLGQEENL
jgi:two-component system, cell cycle sensor histidine kinase and response regulator CckA